MLWSYSANDTEERLYVERWGDRRCEENKGVKNEKVNAYL